MIVQEQPFPEKRMRGVFEELGSSCSKFVSVVKGTQASGKTKLDKERQKLLIREMVRFRLLSKNTNHFHTPLEIIIRGITPVWKLRRTVSKITDSV